MTVVAAALQIAHGVAQLYFEYFQMKLNATNLRCYCHVATKLIALVEPTRSA
jgi:hypothetical protein